MARWVPQQERGFINGLDFCRGGGGQRTDAAAAHLDHRGAWLAGGVLVQRGGRVVAGAVWWIFARDSPEDHPGVSRAELKEIETGLTLCSRRPDGCTSHGPAKISWRLILCAA